ncbi:MAG: DUF1931 domain-containing protein [Candidatus Heimdallarchaeota archaeon]|nr:DUF1931 domain-containing protein [Candidatus Heimdallarchaeota archaeon]MCG3254463.1 DUF1931 domain-containing protein [Candidatus Heimdallarchaeota archaeon]MCK4609547.1 DUF1931 domain-containing protein [Candidatus Heimdallarchaeota archaeon]
MMIVQSKVREYVKELGDYKVGGDLLKALDEKVAILVKSAAGRAKANGRKTVSARDL